jgi:hypothetical protein
MFKTLISLLKERGMTSTILPQPVLPGKSSACLFSFRLMDPETVTEDLVRAL